MRKSCSNATASDIERGMAVTPGELQKVKIGTPVDSYIAVYLSDRDLTCFFGKVIFSGRYFVVAESYFNKNVRKTVRFWELLLMPKSYCVLSDEAVARLKEQLSQGKGLNHRYDCIYHAIWDVGKF